PDRGWPEVRRLGARLRCLRQGWWRDAHPPPFKPSSQIVWLEPEDVADADKATEPGRVIGHNPAFGLCKQTPPASAGSVGIFPVGLPPILKHRPQQATLRLSPQLCGELRWWSGRERHLTEGNTVRFMFHGHLVSAIIKRLGNGGRLDRE